MVEQLTRKIFLAFMLFMGFILWSGALRAQANNQTEAIRKLGFEAAEATELLRHIELLKKALPAYNDSTQSYEMLLDITGSYGNIIQLLNKRKVKAVSLFEIYPESRELLQTGRKAQTRLQYLEKNDRRIQMRKMFRMLEEELLTAGIPKADVSTMLKGFASRVTQQINKKNGHFEGFLRDTHLVTMELASLGQAAMQEGKQQYTLNEECRSAVKRMRNTELHQDEEFAKQTKWTRVIEKIIQIGELILSY
jgi:hypothetical protein